MKAPFDLMIIIPIAVLLVVLMLYVFDRVREDYRRLGKLSPRIALFQTGFFAVYAVASYAFLDSRLALIHVDAWYFPVAMGLLGFGLAIVLMSMPFLGQKSFGAVVGQLNTSGLYAYSRNPQLVGYLLFVFGYALLWPSWQGLLWAALSLVIASLMVRGEEEHLRKVFGEKYREYCRRVPRFIGWKNADRAASVRHRHHFH
jgi:protein-S-isoprenylcysteine O-methyltransferase Ste14